MLYILICYIRFLYALTHPSTQQKDETQILRQDDEKSNCWIILLILPGINDMNTEFFFSIMEYKFNKKLLIKFCQCDINRKEN